MRAAPWLVLAVLLAGCTSFPGTTEVLAELSVGEMRAAEVQVANFTLTESWDFLFVGYRTGPGEHVHVVLRAPDGVRYDVSGVPGGGSCAVTPRPGGSWGLEVATDALDGHLGGGKFTVRGARGERPPVLPCSDEVFPAPGRNATLAWWHATLAPGENVTLEFDQPLDLQRLEILVVNATANATLSAAPLGAPLLPADQLAQPPPHGRWALRVAVPPTESMALLNGTVVARGWG